MDKNNKTGYNAKFSSNRSGSYSSTNGRSAYNTGINRTVPRIADRDDKRRQSIRNTGYISKVGETKQNTSRNISIKTDNDTAPGSEQPVRTVRRRSSNIYVNDGSNYDQSSTNDKKGYSNESDKNKLKFYSKGMYFDYSLLFITIFMICFGLVVLYSASAYEGYMHHNGNSRFFLNGQLIAVGFGIVITAVMVYIIDYNWFKLKAVALLVYGGSVILSLAVLSPLGVDANGAKRWVKIGMSIQVCEVMKIGMIIFMAYYVEKYARNLKKCNVFIIGVIFVVIPGGIIAGITSDLSSAIVIMAIGVVMLFIASPKLSHFIILGILGIVGVLGAIIAQPYRLDRVRAWLHPEKYKGGYQILQSLYSLGSGGIFGKGLGKGIQKLGYVPEAQNDMIFTVICEELGVIGGIAVILMFIFMIWRFMVIAENANDLFGSMLVIGVMTHISVQTIINIAVVTNSMPNTGVTLPFMSYGGSSILCLMFEIGLVLSVSKRISDKSSQSLVQ